MENRERQRFIDALVLGVVGALAALLFSALLNLAQLILLTGIAGYAPPALPGERGGLPEAGPRAPWLLPLATTVGGLVSGLLVFSLAPEAEGHGTDTAVKAFHHEGGRIRARVAPLKMIASAITIGSGGAAGREGPTALITAAVGSVYATWRRRSEEDRRLLVLIGMAAGLSAIFRSPVGTAVFAIEVLYSDMEFETSALLYALLAAIVAYAVNGVFVGWDPLFVLPGRLAAVSAASHLVYVVLGGGAGVVAAVVPTVFYGVRDRFRAMPVAARWKPALGGLGVGLLALGLPQVLGGGYGWIQQAIDGRLPPALLATLVVAKLAAFSLTVGSGGSGGVFAPTLFVGAMLGGTLASALNQPPAALVVVGMAAVFAGAARVPIATLLMVTEMTGGYQLLVPAALAVTLSYLVQRTLSARLTYTSLYEGQVPHFVDSPAHHADQIRAALRLLDDNRVRLDGQVGHLALLSLLRSGIPIDMPGGAVMMLGTLRAESSWAGRPLAAHTRGDADRGGEIVAVVRDSHVLLPRSDTVLAAGDQVVVLVTPDGRAGLTRHLAWSCRDV